MLKKICNKDSLYLFLVGLISSLIFAPTFCFPLVFIAFPYFFFCIDRASNYKKAYINGIIFGFGHYLSGMYWITNSLFVDIKQFWFLVPFALFGIPIVLAVLFSGPFATCFYFMKKRNHLYNITIFSIFFVLFELLRTYLFTGLPWNLLGYSFGFSEYLMQIAAYVGIYGVGFIIVFSSLLLTYWQYNKKIAICVLFIYTAIFFFGYYRIRSAEVMPSGVIIRIVQPNIPQNIKYLPEGAIIALKSAIELSKIGNNSKISAIIWPEGAIDFLVNTEYPLSFAKSFLLEEQYLIAGAIREENGKKKIFNSLLVINDQGKIVDFYDKMHLVPFGEYVPFSSILKFNVITNMGMNFTHGKNTKSIKLHKLPAFYPLICYEVIFPHHEKPKEEFDWIVNLTTDAWYGKSSGPYQHLQKARFRAIEHRKPLVRVASTGISAVIDSFGRIVSEIALDETGVLDVQIPGKLK